MNEAVTVDGDSDVKLLSRQVHEHKIAGLQVAASDRGSGMQLFSSSARQPESRAGGRVHHETTAVEAAGCGSTVTIRLAQHGRGAVDNQRPGIERRGGRRGGSERPGGIAGTGRSSARGESDGQAKYQYGSENTQTDS